MLLETPSRDQVTQDQILFSCLVHSQAHKTQLAISYGQRIWCWLWM